ncbi:YqaJ viral recombinase family protein [Thiopseudomonas alkaliphila]|uniref:YqaJ viral recombinase family nuclease n=1 Tax=Thiopseudomonas alkaliphila TaxID=1697053 RepID=UPI003570CC67
MNAKVLATPIKASARPALRLVSTKELSRDEWLAVRKNGIGSSDAAAAVGLNPYKSQLELWMEKTGRDQGLAKPDPSDDKSPVYWGTLLEPIVATQYTQQTGKRVRRVNAVLQHPNPELSWMLANIDREVVADKEVQILECKTAGINGARLWKEGVPEYVQLQVMHQLAVTGKQAADVAVLLGGQELKVYRIERDEQMIAQLIQLEKQFWHYVETDTPPPADGTQSSEAALRCLFPKDEGETVDFSLDETLATVFTELKQVREDIGTKEKQESLLKQKIQQAMGNASRALFATGAVTWRKAKDSVTVDTAALLRDLPHLKEQYQITRQGSRRFLIS